MKSSAGLTRIEVIGSIVVVLFVAGLVLGWLFPATGGSGIRPARKAQAKNDVTQIAVAVTAYHTEYERFPPMPTNGFVSGELVSTLAGSNQALNPRNLVFIEINPAKKNWSGLRDGTFVDPWGGPYRIAIATATNNYAAITAGTNQVSLRKKVAVWNDPSTHPKSFFGDDTKKKARRYVTSWE